MPTDEHTIDHVAWQHEPAGAPLPGWTVGRHLALYADGWFPMADPDATPYDGREVDFYKPHRRAVLPLTEADGFHMPRTACRELRRGAFGFTCNTAFRDVMLGCAQPRGDTARPWISGRIVKMYRLLHEAGHAHSIEAWRTDPETDGRVLVGGLYGLSIGAAFFAESMFHRARPRLPDGTRHPLDGTNASSCTLITLARHLRTCGYVLLDVQILNDHTARFGAHEVDPESFEAMLRGAVRMPDLWRPLRGGPDS